MNREEVQLLGFEIVAYAGDARSKLLEALNAANEGDFEKLNNLLRKQMNVLQMPIKLKQTYWLKKRKVMTLQYYNDSRTRPFNDNVIKRFNEAFN